MRYDSIIFDIDGTLWNACPASAKGWNNAIASLGENKVIKGADVAGVAGKPFEDCVRQVYPSLVNKHAKVMEILTQYERRALEQQGGDLYQGVFEGIKKLSKQYKLYLVSNCQDWYLDLFLKFSNMKQYFKDYTCHGSTQISKAKMIEGMVNKHELKNPVYVGDTMGDLEGAVGAGVRFIHATYGFGNFKTYSLSFSSFNDLTSYFI